MPASSKTFDIDGYLAALPDDMRAAVAALRGTIAQAAPEAVEGVSYGMPAFRYRDRPLVAYQAARGHYALYPMDPALIVAHAAELAGFDTAKGTIRFRLGEPLPVELVATIVHERLAAIEAAGRR